MQPEDYISFLMRLWRDHPGANQLDGWHGEIEQIQTGTRWSFCSLDELLAFLHQLTVASQAGTQLAAEAPFDD
jgi:hypothetical protein